MPSSSSSSRRGEVRETVLAVVVLASLLHSCALGLEFESLDNTCDLPAFDLAALPEYCTGRLNMRETYAPEPLSSIGEGLNVSLTDTDGDLVAAAAVYFSGVEGEPACQRADIGLTLGRKADEGPIAGLGTFVGREYGLSFFVPQEEGSCADGANAAWVWPTEVWIADPVRLQVMASFGDGGLLTVYFDGSGGVVAAFHLAGSPVAPAARTCVAGVCATLDGQLCIDHAECGPDSYCDDRRRCAPLDECVTGGDCPTGQRCALQRGVCAIQCNEHSGCPHPLTCQNDGLCGGGGCAVDVGCGLGFECNPDGACVATCADPDDTRCPTGLTCLAASDEEGFCGTGGRIGICTNGPSDCHLGRVTGFTPIPANTVTFGLPGLLIATDDRGIRLAALPPGSTPYLFPASSLSDTLEGEFTDVLYVPDFGAVYLALPAYGVVRFEWDALLAGASGSELLHFRELDLAAAAPVSRLERVGDRLVVFEGGHTALLATGQPQPSRARILPLNEDPALDMDLAQQLLVDLGETAEPTVARLEDLPEVLMFGVDRQVGGQLVFVRDQGEGAGEVLQTLDVQATGTTGTNFVGAWPDIAYLGSSSGLTPVDLDLEGP